MRRFQLIRSQFFVNNKGNFDSQTDGEGIFIVSVEIMSELLVVPLKKPSEVDVIKPLKNLIQSSYSGTDASAADHSEAISEFSKLRNTAIWKAFEKYESSLEILYGYDYHLTLIISSVLCIWFVVTMTMTDVVCCRNFFHDCVRSFYVYVYVFSSPSSSIVCVSRTINTSYIFLIIQMMNESYGLSLFTAHSQYVAE